MRTIACNFNFKYIRTFWSFTNVMNPILQMKEHLKGWEPLQDPRKSLSSFKAWRDLLEDPNRHYKQSVSNTMDAYERLLWDVWIPYIRTAIR